MNKAVRTAMVTLFSLCIAVSAYTVDEQLVNRYLNAANEQYSTGNMPKAFSYINIVLNSYKEEALPENIEVIAETIYYAYLEQIKNSRNSTAFNQVKEKLIAFPFLSSERINRTIKIINTYEAQDIAWGADPTRAMSSGAVVGDNNPALYSTLQLQLALEESKQAALDKEKEEQEKFRAEILDTQKSAFETAFDKASEVNKSSNRAFLLVLIILSVIGFTVFVVVVLNIVVNMRNAKTQNEKFVETLKAVSQLSRMPLGMAGIEALPPSFASGENLRLIGSGTPESNIPPEPETVAAKSEFDGLVKKCREVGLQIDQATARKNNAKNVAEMVYKVSQEMGLTQYESMVYYAVSLVYDIGFLEIDQALLMADNLTEDQKFEIRNHVKQGLAQISFVPEAYMSVFADGVLMHHENMDGSGYPEGLEGSRIPYIARVIHVAESFNALISKRSYREIYDKESAVEELRKKPGLYDPSIVEILERII